jgi:hypothetical protein
MREREMKKGEKENAWHHYHLIIWQSSKGMRETNNCNQSTSSTNNVFLAPYIFLFGRSLWIQFSLILFSHSLSHTLSSPHVNRKKRNVTIVTPLTVVRLHTTTMKHKIETYEIMHSFIEYIKRLRSISQFKLWFCESKTWYVPSVLIHAIIFLSEK